MNIKKKQYLQTSRRYCMQKPSAELSEKPLNRIWAPFRIGLPVKRACLPQLE